MRRSWNSGIGWKLAAAMAAAAILASAAAAQEVVPDPSDQAAAGYWETPVNEVAGVRVLAESDVWDGSMDVLEYVLPIMVTVENNGKVPVRFRFQDLALIDPDGVRYAALPPYDIKGSEEQEVPSDLYQPQENPAFTAQGFQVAPNSSSLYPTITPYPDQYNYDEEYNETYSTFWRDNPLPTPEMLAKGVPEGVILPGGSLSGFVYFEKPAPERRLRFQEQLVDDATGKVFGVATLYFDVVRGDLPKEPKASSPPTPRRR